MNLSLAESRDLSVGVVSQNNVSSELLLEILDHQGVCYEQVQTASASSKTYPVVLIADNSSQDSALLARGACASGENVVVASQIIDLNSILSSLSGLDNRAQDRLDMIVNEEEVKLTAEIKEALSRQGFPLVRKWFWPNFAKTCCVLSHDIDWLTYSPFHRAVLEGELGAFQIIKLAINNIFRRRDYGWNIPQMIELESKHGFKSSFYFQTSYEKGQALAEESIRALKEKEFEIGLHGYHSSHKDGAALKSELAKFHAMVGTAPEGLRYHILKFKVPETWLLEHEAGLRYDATFAYNEYYGFRSGVCFPYHPFSDKRLPILELPTGFMDWTSLHRKDRGEKAMSMLRAVKTGAEKYHGLLVVDFHNTYLNKDSFPDIYNAYENLLNEISAEQYWVATAAECAKWWQRRASAKPNPKLDGSDQPIFEQTGIPLVAEYEDKILPLS